MTIIQPLKLQSAAAIDAVLDAAFGADRHGRTAYRIREGMDWLSELSFAAIDADGRLIGTLQSWPVALSAGAGAQHPLIMVGPVAVLPDHQGGGVGRALMDRVVATARAQATEPLTMIGDPEYYGRFWGFSADGTGQWEVPGPAEQRRLLMLSVDGRIMPLRGMLGPRVEQGALPAG